MLSAAEAGSTIEDVLGALGRASTKPLPKNVAREIAGWMAAVRRGKVRRVESLECADEESAARVADLLGANARRQRRKAYSDERGEED